MAIYTSNYARHGSHPNAISISRRPPNWFRGKHLPEFAPTWDMIMGLKQGNIDQREYTRLYLNILDNLNLNPKELYNWLSETPDPTFFLCYEAPRDFCHRHIFSVWVEETTGWVIPEWKNEKELAEERKMQTVDSLLEF